MTEDKAAALEEVRAHEAELERIEGAEWGQGPGSSYYREVELNLLAARHRAGLPALNYTYAGPAYALNMVPSATGLGWLGQETWPAEPIAGAFGIVQRLGDGGKIVAVILDNGEGKRWMATDLEQLERVD
jgi:hypothetical protein